MSHHLLLAVLLLLLFWMTGCSTTEAEGGTDEGVEVSDATAPDVESEVTDFDAEVLDGDALEDEEVSAGEDVSDEEMAGETFDGVDMSIWEGNFLRSDHLMNIAHRGGAHLAPESTLIAFDNAVAVQADVLELDIHASRDGVLVVCHDELVDRTTDGSGLIKEMTLEELQQLDAGYRFTRDGGETFPYRGQGVTIPTLEEVLTQFEDQYFIIEIKQFNPPITDTLLDLLSETGMEEQVVIASMVDDTLRTVRQANPAVMTSFGAGEAILFNTMSDNQLSSYAVPAPFMQVPQADDEFLARAEHFGIKVHVWTIDARDDMEQMIERGVDGIITNDPQLLHDVLSERGF